MVKTTNKKTKETKLEEELDFFCPICKSIIPESGKLIANKQYTCDVCGKNYYLIKPREFTFSSF